MIGEDIEIVILEITPSQVRLGVKAPRDRSIYRKEIFMAIQEENIKASSLNINLTGLAGDLKGILKRRPE
jgi:carbon storage regulator